MFIKNFYNKHKKLLMTFGSIVVVLYLIFLFLIPNVINLNNYKRDIQKIVSDTVKLDFDVQDIKIVTTPTLKAGLKLTGTELFYPDKKKIASVAKAEVKISLLPLILKTVQISDIKIDSPQLELVYTRDAQIDLVKYIFENMPAQEVSADSAQAELPVKISDRLPDIVINHYKLALKDEKTSNKIVLDGENFVFDKAVINKHLRAAAKGKVLLNGEENVNFDVSVSSFWPALPETQAESKETVVYPSIDFINEIVKYSPKADIFADLKIFEHSGHVDVVGKADVQKISIILDGTRLPDGHVTFEAKGHDTLLDSQLFVSKSESANLFADIKTGNSTKIDVTAKTDKISFSNLQKFAYAILNSLNIKNDLNSFSVNGYIAADFNVKTNLKKFTSNGYLKAVDGSVSHKLIPLNISKIVADVNFDNNSLNLKQVGALINGNEISANGSIDSNAVADLSVKSGNINIAPLFNAFAPADLKKAYILKSGIVALNAVVKGKLTDIEPNINVNLSNLVLNDKAKTFALTNSSSLVNIKTKGTSFSGNVNVNNTLFTLFNPKTVLSIPSVKLNITPENIEIVPFYVSMNSSKVNVSGMVKDYMDKMGMNILADGNISAMDLKRLLPKEILPFIAAQGYVPIKANVTGNAQKINVDAQALSGANSYFSPVTVKKMLGKNGLLNVSMTYADDDLGISDASLYIVPKMTLGPDFSTNKKGAVKIAGLNGVLNGLMSSHPSMKLIFSVPEQLVLSNVAFPNAQLSAKGEISILGLLTSPSFNGFLSIKDVNIPEFLTKVQAVDVELNDKTVTAKVQNLDLNGTSMNVDTVASTIFSNVFIVKSLKLTSAYFDVDKLFVAMDKMMAAMPAPATSVSKSNAPTVPIKLSNGSIDIQKLKMKQIGGDFVANSITGDFTIVNDLFKLNNLKTTVYNGNVAGDVTYHLATTAITANVKGKGIDANPIITVFAALKDQIEGNADFSANVKLKGATYEQQMKSLNGNVSFSMKDGQLGSLGRFETFLKADNLLTQNFISTKIGSLVNTVAPYNTGKFDYLTGEIKLKNGVATLSPVKMSGKHMSLLITGDVNILSMDSSLNVSGFLSSAVASVLGPVSDLTVERFASYIPKFGSKIAGALTTFNEAANKADLAKIPVLSGVTENAKAFKVVLKGNMNNPVSIVKRFQWLNSPEAIKAEKEALSQQTSETASVVKTPMTKEAVKEEVKGQLKNTLQNNEKVQELKQNKTVKTVDSILKFYKDNSSKGSTAETAQ